MAKAEGASEPFRRFEALTKKLLNVPKKEVDEKEKERPKRQRNQSKPAE
jgi:hypothetical protein